MTRPKIDKKSPSIPKVYTRTGDQGATSLASGERVSKADLRIAAYGTVDEFNAVVGILQASLKKISKKFSRGLDVTAALEVIQIELFDVGAELACHEESALLRRLTLLQKSSIERLEQEIDQMSESLPPMRNFILPGGSIEIATAHLARTVCRRVEREVVGLASTGQVRAEVLHYFNRLSDWLFTLCRYIALRTRTAEVIWKPRK